jgi:hypothetical protein
MRCRMLTPLLIAALAAGGIEPVAAQEAAPPAPEQPVATEGHRPARCASLPEKRRRNTEECKTEEERREDAQQKRREDAAEKEKPKHTSFWRWVHLDGLSLPTASGVGVYGLVGTHVAVANIGRVYVFGPPGVMLLLEEAGRTRRLKPAFTWGVDLYLSDFRFPGTDRTAQLYVNLTKCWTASYQNGIDMFGLSLSWKKS